MVTLINGFPDNQSVDVYIQNLFLVCRFYSQNLIPATCAFQSANLYSNCMVY